MFVRCCTQDIVPSVHQPPTRYRLRNTCLCRCDWRYSRKINMCESCNHCWCNKLARVACLNEAIGDGWFLQFLQCGNNHAVVLNALNELISGEDLIGWIPRLHSTQQPIRQRPYHMLNWRHSGFQSHDLMYMISNTFEFVQYILLIKIQIWGSAQCAVRNATCRDGTSDVGTHYWCSAAPDHTVHTVMVPSFRTDIRHPPNSRHTCGETAQTDRNTPCLAMSTGLSDLKHSKRVGRSYRGSFNKVTGQAARSKYCSLKVQGNKCRYLR